MDIKEAPTLRLIALLPFLLCGPLLSAQQEVLKVEFPDSTVEYHITYITADTLSPFKKIAFFSAYPDQTALIEHYRNGRLNGRRKVFYPSGQLYDYKIYGNGSLHGDYISYYPDGSIHIKGRFKNGQAHGFWSVFEEEKCYGKYKNGAKKGTWRCHDKNNVVHLTKYKNGEVIAD